MRQDMGESTLLRAQAGAPDAFQELTDPFRRELQVHCYRILGSYHDAEDVLQETLLSAWQAIDRFDGRSLRAWLYRIATNRCLNYLRDASRRPKSGGALDPGDPFARASRSEEPWWLEPYPDALIDDVELGPEARYSAREGIALSFVAGLQRLPTQQRAALVLRDVLGFSAAEAAEILNTTPVSINSALQRARVALPSHEDIDVVPLPRSEHESQILDRFVRAMEAGDSEQLVAVLTEEARLTMPPEPFEFQGPEKIAAFLREACGGNLKLVPTRANNQPAFGYYRPDPNANVVRASGIIVLEVAVDGVAMVTRFDTGMLACFGLPRTLPR
jgi:RNA polymerase sigma-70 factor (ECF subfamily)